MNDIFGMKYMIGIYEILKELLKPCDHSETVDYGICTGCGRRIL